MKPLGVSSEYLAKLAMNCLDIQPEILPCDIFRSQAVLTNNKSFIINIQISNLPGSHFVGVLIKRNKILYFDSLAFPLINSYIETKLEALKKPIYYCTKPIQGANSVFCGLYCLCFLIICQKRKKKFEEFLKMFSFGSPGSYIKNEKKCTEIIKSNLTVS